MKRAGQLAFFAAAIIAAAVLPRIIRGQVPNARPQQQRTFLPGASYDAAGLGANFSSQTISPSVPFTGFYRLECFIVLTQAATTSSSTPYCNFAFSRVADGPGGGGYGYFGGGDSSNTVGHINNNGQDNCENTVYLQAGSTIVVNGQSYASSGATPMQYAVHIRVEYLGQ